MKVGQTSDMINMMLQLLELETFLTPDMNVYNSLVETGFSFLLFGTYRSFLTDITIVEEFIELSIKGLQVQQTSEFSTLH